MVRGVAAFVVAAALCACGAAVQEPLTVQTHYEDPALAERALLALGERAFEAMRDGEPSRLFFDDLALHALLDTQSASHAVQLKARLGQRLETSREAMRFNLRNTTYQGVCAQGVYDATNSRFGLRSPAWVVERLFVVAHSPTVGPVAAWVEGVFVLTNRGLGAIDVAHVEAPRPGHSDLELATCELSANWHPHNGLGGSQREPH